ncbi:GGDEF domain-containing protein, partial [Actinotalea ferrariae]|uniref:GGDEF domain-containing protein n=1 Tax=Actinotalea ferrariae TaxID=1386098 RepID=UPI001C8C9C7C
MGSALGELAAELHAAGELAAAREERLALLADRLASVVRIAREVSGSVSVRYVAEAVSSAAADLLRAPVTLWVRTDDGELRAARRSDDPHGVVPPSDVPVPEAAAASAADARPVVDESGRAHPLVLGGMVVGVLHVPSCSAHGAVPDTDTLEVLAALLSTAAAALESARLHRTARDQADHDALTQLPNRRRLDADLAVEWDRSQRYGRPLSFLMVDLDHFKRLNDAHGHLAGDAVLHDVAAAVAAGLRSTDTAYRFGGEEIAVLLRETGAADALPIAERIRAAIASVRVPGVDARVTASVGLADRGDAMHAATDLVEAADAALYTAKRSGRDRVALAPTAAQV